VCTDWEGNNQPLYMVLANRRQVSPAVRVLREFLVERMNAFVAA
jgi:DNA-binding transcriptional LysR family regulator